MKKPKAQHLVLIKRNSRFLLTGMLFMMLWTSHPKESAFADMAFIDPDIQSGFPVQTFHTEGSYYNINLNALVGNFDADPTLEIVATNLATGPVFAWNSDGSLMDGWPPNMNYGSGYSAAGNLTGSAITLEVVTNFYNSVLNVFNISGGSLPGWPQPHLGTGRVSPSLADVDGDGLDEIFSEQNDRKLYARKFDGNVIPGWPVEVNSTGQGLYTPAIADLDGDGDLEIITTSQSSSSGATLAAFHHDGVPLSGFPIIINGYSHTPMSIGDVDGDNELEIVIVEYQVISIYSKDGILERQFPFQGKVMYRVDPVLADLNDDHIPEILILTNDYLSVFYGDGTIYPGWPQYLGSIHMSFQSSVVIGDVDGDQQQDIVITLWDNFYRDGDEVRIYNRNGVQHSRSPKILNLGGGGGPAIADIDLDGRNEIVIFGSFWDGRRGFFDKIWVLDMGGSNHGRVEWGQFRGGPQNRSLYPSPVIPEPLIAPPGINPIYLPMIIKQQEPAQNGIHGMITFSGSGIANIPLGLYLYNGTSWSLKRTCTTTQKGTFDFPNAPSLGTGGQYFVRYINALGDAGKLASWTSRIIYRYSSGDTVGTSRFDISDLALISPDNDVQTAIPATFNWTKRESASGEYYSLILYDPIDANPLYQSTPYRSIEGIQLIGLPNGFSYYTPYAWTILPIGPDGAVGVPSESRLITFVTSTSSSEARLLDDSFHIDWLPLMLNP